MTKKFKVRLVGFASSFFRLFKIDSRTKLDNLNVRFYIKPFWLLFCILLFQLPYALSDENPLNTLHLAVFAYRPKPILQERYQPLADYLSEKLGGSRVELSVLGLDEIEQRLANGELDFIFTNPSHYTLLRNQNKLTGALATLISLEGGQATSFLGGVIITRSEIQNIQTLGDLKGCRIAIPGTKYLGGYQTQAFELLKAGILLPQDAELKKTGSHDAVVAEVLAGNVDAGFIRTGIIEEMTVEGKLNPNRLRVVNLQQAKDFPYRVSTRLYPEWAFVALPHADNHLVRKVASALLALDEQHPAAQAANIGGFSPPADYLPVENIVRALHLPPFDHVPPITWLTIWNRYRFQLITVFSAFAVISLLLVRLFQRNRTLAVQQVALRKSRNELAAAQAVAKVGSWTIDLSSRVIEWSKETYRMFGVPEHHRVDLTLFISIIHPDDRALVLESWNKAVNGIPYDIEHRIWVEDKVFWVRERAEFSYDQKTGKAISAIGTVLDITEQKQAEEQIKLSASVFCNAREAIFITDANGVIVDLNQAFSEVTGYHRDDALGKTPKLLQSGQHSQEFYAELWKELLDKGYWSGEIWNRHKNGKVFAELLTIIAVKDSNGQTSHYVAMFSDITEQKAQQKQLEYIAHYDALTGLPNRVLLADRLHQAMKQAKRRNQQLAVAYIDLDGFKVVNDTYGHRAGDHLLIHFSKLVHQTLREGDTIARLGGDEFIAVLIDLPGSHTATPYVQRLLEIIAQPIPYEGSELKVSGSIGVSFYPQEEDINADQLVRQADQAMYHAKLAGKNRYHIYDPGKDSIIRVHHESIEKLNRALEQNEFCLYYQPKVNLRTRKVIGFEALLRWQHPEKGILTPMMFLPEIIDPTLCVNVGSWVLKTALAQIQTWQNQGLNIGVSVNISPHQLQKNDFVDQLRKQLQSYPDLPANSLELEILETGALEDIKKVSKIILECREFNVRFALDDFGTGYSTLTYLKDLPANTLKIDQSFVRDMLDDPEDLAILQGILGLANAFHRDVVAEGVETIDQAKLLLELGCEVAQGYFIAKPMPSKLVNEWLTNWYKGARLWEIQ